MASHSSVGAARQHSRILFVKNLNYNTTGADLYQVFGRYGAIRQIRLGDGAKTKGTAYVVYEEMADAKRASDNLNGFHLNERYIVGKYIHSVIAAIAFDTMCKRCSVPVRG